MLIIVDRDFESVFGCKYFGIRLSWVAYLCRPSSRSELVGFVTADHGMSQVINQNK